MLILVICDLVKPNGPELHTNGPELHTYFKSVLGWAVVVYYCIPKMCIQNFQDPLVTHHGSKSEMMPSYLLLRLETIWQFVGVILIVKLVWWIFLTGSSCYFAAVGMLFCSSLLLSRVSAFFCYHLGLEKPFRRCRLLRPLFSFSSSSFLNHEWRHL